MKILYAGSDPDLVMTNTGESRQPGVHLSDILVRLAWEKDRKYHPDAPKDYMVFEQGHTWETVLSRALSARNARPGYRPEQIQEDGIWLSPDHLNPDADVQAEEWKATKKSSKSLDQKIEEWLPQAKSYVRALLRRRLITRPVIRFRVWCINGDWSFEAKGDLALLRDYFRVDIEFDKRELEEQWRANVALGKKYGLLKEEREPCRASQRTERSAHRLSGEKEQWQNRPRLNRTMARRQKAGSQPASEQTARTITFPTTRKSSKPRAGS